MLESEYQDDFENGGSNPASSVDENAIQVATNLPSAAVIPHDTNSLSRASSSVKSSDDGG